MSDDRESPSRAAEAPETSANPGAPVAETEASHTEVLEAVERSRGATDVGNGTSATTDGAVGSGEPAVSGDVAADADELARRTRLAEVDTELDMAPSPDADLAATTAVVPGDPTSRAGAADSAPEPTPATALDDLPSAAATPATALSPERDGEIRISSDHPMAGFYVQTPLPPDIRGNRGAGVLISLLATVGFAVVFTGIIALLLAPSLAPSQFVNGVLDVVVSWSFIAPAVAFLVGMILLVLIVGRAGWWAYVLGGFFVAVLVWVAAAFGAAADADGVRALFDRSPVETLRSFGFGLRVLAAAVVAREAAVWFGAWIGARGRRMKMRNAVALAEYETALVEAQAKQA